MKTLRNIMLFFLPFAAIGVAAYSFYLSSLNPCQKILEYSIGTFDTQFGLSQEDFKADIAEASAVWEKALGKPVFVYKPDAPFKVNLIYDERQIATVQKQKTESGLSVVEAVFKSRDTEFRDFKARYDKRVAAYEQEAAAYDARKSAYEQEVASWNGKGGAPQEKYDELEKEREYLNAEGIRLANEVSALKDMTDRLNALLAQRNAKATEYNKVAQEYNNRYNHGFEFNQAEYNGKEINVYQFGNKQDLVLALVHEFGHALGMNHVENPKSVMYYLTGMNAETSPMLSGEDVAELKNVCEI